MIIIISIYYIIIFGILSLCMSAHYWGTKKILTLKRFKYFNSILLYLFMCIPVQQIQIHVLCALVLLQQGQV